MYVRILFTNMYVYYLERRVYIYKYTHVCVYTGFPSSVAICVLDVEQSIFNFEPGGSKTCSPCSDYHFSRL